MNLSNENILNVNFVATRVTSGGAGRILHIASTDPRPRCLMVVRIVRIMIIMVVIHQGIGKGMHPHPIMGWVFPLLPIFGWRLCPNFWIYNVNVNFTCNILEWQMTLSVVLFQFVSLHMCCICAMFKLPGIRFALICRPERGLCSSF